MHCHPSDLHSVRDGGSRRRRPGQLLPTLAQQRRRRQAGQTIEGLCFRTLRRRGRLLEDTAASEYQDRILHIHEIGRHRRNFMYREIRPASYERMDKKMLSRHIRNQEIYGVTARAGASYQKQEEDEISARRGGRCANHLPVGHGHHRPGGGLGQRWLLLHLGYLVGVHFPVVFEDEEEEIVDELCIAVQNG